ncbi:MAG: HK97-gp10 family putative phage morphogenesis protein [Desulfitobacteriaceae bacterium]
MANIKLVGMDDLMTKLQAMGDKASRIEGDALRAAAEPVAEEIKSLVRFGSKNDVHIRDDIEISKVKTKDGIKYIEVGPGKKTNWRAKFLEFGTKNMTAIPFMAPAYEHKKREVTEIISRKIREALGL